MARLVKRRVPLTVWVLVSVGTVACSRSSDPQRRLENPADAVQVLVIGTIHSPAGLLLDSSYSAAQVRAALTAFQPTAIAIEVSPLWNAWGVSLEATWEIDQVVVPWAREHAVPVFGVDWAPVEELASRAQARVRTFRESLSSAPPRLDDLRDRARQRAEGVLASRHDAFADPAGLHAHEWFNWINSGARSRATPVRVWWETRGSNDPGGNVEAAGRAVDFIMARHDRVVRQVKTLAARVRGGRLAILMGYSHKPDLDRRLAELSGVQVVQLGDLSGFTSEAVTLAWRRDDALATLREGLDGDAFYLFPEGVDQSLMTRALHAYEGAGPPTNEGRYYAARLAALRGDVRAAIGLLQNLLQRVESERPSLPAYSDVPTLEQRIRCELGRLFDLTGDRPEALSAYQEVLEAITEALATAPDQRTFESTTDWATAGYALGQHLSRIRAFRDMVRALLQQPWSSS